MCAGGVCIVTRATSSPTTWSCGAPPPAAGLCSGWWLGSKALESMWAGGSGQGAVRQWGRVIPTPDVEDSAQAMFMGCMPLYVVLVGLAASIEQACLSCGCKPAKLFPAHLSCSLTASWCPSLCLPTPTPRLIAHIAPDGVSANSYGGIALLILIVMSGFTIVRKSIPDWWIWAY